MITSSLNIKIRILANFRFDLWY